MVEGFVSTIIDITGHNWQKMKNYIPDMSLPWNVLSRSSRSKNFQLYLKNQNFCEFVKFEAISWKPEFLWITASLKFEFKNPFVDSRHI